MVQTVCQGSEWEARFTPMARSQLEEGYYGDLLVYSDYTNPLKGKFDLTRRDVQSQYPQIGWFAVDTITCTEGIVGSITLRFEQKGLNRPVARGYLAGILCLCTFH